MLLLEQLLPFLNHFENRNFTAMVKQFFRRTFFCNLGLLFLLLGSSHVHAQVDRQWFIYQAAEVSFWYPDNWELEQQETTVRLQHTASGLSVTFTLLEDTQMEEAFQGLEQLVAEQVEEPTWSSDPALIDWNGIMGVGAEVEGKIEGQPIQMGLFLLERPQKVLLVIGLGDQAALQEHQESLDKILQSIQPI